MKKIRPNRAWYALFGISAFTVLILGSAVWHILIEVYLLDCPSDGIVCLFIPDSSDWYIHLISYVLMVPLISAMFLWFKSWREQWIHTRALTSNLSRLTTESETLEKLSRRLGLQDRVYLLDSDDYISFCACYFSPRIYVSRGVVETLNEYEMEALLLHEKCHLENRDPLKIFLGRLLVSAFFFIPVLKDFFRKYLVGKEINADRSAVRYQGSRRGILGTLEKLLHESGTVETMDFAVSGTNTIGHRIASLTGYAYNERISLLHTAVSSIVLLLVIGSIVASLTVF